MTSETSGSATIPTSVSTASQPVREGRTPSPSARTATSTIHAMNGTTPIPPVTYDPSSDSRPTIRSVCPMAISTSPAIAAADTIRTHGARAVAREPRDGQDGRDQGDHHHDEERVVDGAPELAGAAEEQGQGDPGQDERHEGDPARQACQAVEIRSSP